MKTFSLIILLLLPYMVNGQTSSSPKTMAITIDDLPVISLFRDIASKQAITRKLLATLTRYQVPAVGFVNESKLYQQEALDQQSVALLQAWLEAGLELGNHTFSHKSYHTVSLKEYAEDLKKGELITESLSGRKIRYFRHPFLHVGNTEEKKRQLEAFLSANDYQAAPVTVDNSDWIFARAYDHALLAGDSTMAQKIGKAYISYMGEKVTYFEQQSEALLGYNLKQILLLHANTINADYLDELLEMISRQGYAFIRLEEALTDPAYTSEDHYTGNAGISWLHRWAITQGKKGDFFKGDPRTPSFVMEVAEITAE